VQNVKFVHHQNLQSVQNIKSVHTPATNPKTPPRDSAYLRDHPIPPIPSLLPHAPAIPSFTPHPKKKPWGFQGFGERETRVELATSTLARWHSTTELLPQI
jgi:hypothetical protein